MQEKGETNMTGRQQGFSLVELIVAMAVILIVMGGVFQILSQSQQRFVATTSAEDSTASGREALDLMVREMSLAGYPPANSYAAGVITVSNQNLVSVAGGFLAASNYAVQFEADLTDSGTVTVVNYQLQVPTGVPFSSCPGAATNGNLTVPTLMRSAVAKNANGAAVTPSFEPFLSNVQNCANGAPIFRYCPAPPTGTLVTAPWPADPNPCPDMSTMRATSLAAPQNTRTVLIQVQTLAMTRDPQTGQFSLVEFFDVAQRLNPDQ